MSSDVNPVLLNETSRKAADPSTLVQAAGCFRENDISTQQQPQKKEIQFELQPLKRAFKSHKTKPVHDATTTTRLVILVLNMLITHAGRQNGTPAHIRQSSLARWPVLITFSASQLITQLSQCSKFLEYGKSATPCCRVVVLFSSFFFFCNFCPMAWSQQACPYLYHTNCGPRDWSMGDFIYMFFLHCCRTNVVFPLQQP